MNTQILSAWLYLDSGSVLDGFSLQADFWRFEVEDRVLPEPPIRALQPEIDAFIAASQDPGNYILNDTIPADSPQPYTPVIRQRWKLNMDVIPKNA